FAARGNSDLLKALDEFALFSTGHGKKISNVMRGRSSSIELAIFDYRYVTGTGRSSRAWTQTVISFQSDATALPQFTLGPRSFWSKVGSWFGRPEIEFEDQPKFSEQYLLRGSDTEAIRKLFTGVVREHFEQNPGYNVEGAIDRLLL